MALPVQTPPAQGAPPVDGLRSILEWSATLYAWQKDALRRLCAGPDLDAKDEAELLAILKGAASSPLTDQHIGSTSAAAQPIRLKSIRNVEHVNALAPRQTLSFSDNGMTIVYGDNGSGKSGYVRILKAACHARRERGFDILSNIYDTVNRGAPTAEITYYDGQTRRSAVWVKDTPSLNILSNIAVFDSAAGNIHVNGTNVIAYTPFPLLILERLARSCDNLRTRLNTEIAALGTQYPPTVAKHQCSKLTKAGKLLDSLSGTTKIADVEALSLLSDLEKAELVSLRKDLADDPEVIAKRSTTLAQRLRGLGTMISGIAEALNDARLGRILALRHEIATTTQDAQADALKRFAAEPLPVGGPAWGQLWDAARAYAEEYAHPSLPFPQTGEGSVCVLCQRPHDDASADRFDRFQAFIVDELGKQIKTAEAALGAGVVFNGADYLRPGKIRDIRDFLTAAGEPDLATAISDFLVHAAWRMRWALRVPPTLDLDGAPLLPTLPTLAIEETAARLLAKARTMQGSATSPERQALKSRLDELADHEWLAVVKDDVIKAISLKAQTAKLTALLPATARAKVTTKSTALAKDLVTDRLRDRFALEVSELGISRLRVELRQEKSEAGQPRFKVVFVANPAVANIGAILSEGELRSLAIAAFLAELETADNKSGIVMDDPICSLDHVHREKVAQRLAKEALHRQVVVFTHDVPFLSQLQRACRDAQAIMLMRLVSRGANPGFCHDDAPPTHRPIEDAITAVARDIENKRPLFDTGHPDWVNCVTGFGGTLRKLWERAVEEVMSPVLTRWTSKIDTINFMKLSVIQQTDHDTMRAAYGLCSVWEHYQPAAANTPQPSANDIAAEAAKLRVWIAAIKTRQSRH